MKLYQAYGSIFGHEFTHYIESKKSYNSFKNYLFKNSIAFENYIKGRVESETGEEFTGSREELLKAYADMVCTLYRSSPEMSKPLRERFTIENAEEEMVADFVGDVLLGSEDFDITEKALEEIANTDRSLIQRIIDYIKDLIVKLKGQKQNKTLVEDLEYLTKRLQRVYDSAEVKNHDMKDRDSFAGEHAKTANIETLSQAKERIANGEDSETVRKETGWFKGYDGKWRFELNIKDLIFDKNLFYKKTRNPDIKRHRELEYKFIIGEITESEHQELKATPHKKYRAK